VKVYLALVHGKVFGEGPAMESAAALTAQGFNEGKGKPFTAEDIRFTAKGNTLYAIALGTPSANKILIKTLSAENRKSNLNRH